MNAAQLRALGRTIELCGLGAATRVVTDPDPLRRNGWVWEIGSGDTWTAAFSGPLGMCNQLDNAYTATKDDN